MRVVAGNQLTLSLEPGLLHRFSTLRDCLHSSVLADPRGMKAVAADCDISVSELSRRLAPHDGDPRSCDVNLMVQIMASTCDLTPLHWLMARFLPDDASRRAAAVSELAALLPRLSSLIDAAGVNRKGGTR